MRACEALFTIYAYPPRVNLTDLNSFNKLKSKIKIQIGVNMSEFGNCMLKILDVLFKVLAVSQ